MSITPLRLEVDDLALARDERDGAGDPVLVDVAPDHLVDPVEPLGRDADLLGILARGRSSPATARGVASRSGTRESR